MHRRRFPRTKPTLSGLAAVTVLISFAVVTAPEIGSASVDVPTSTTSRTADDTSEVRLDTPSSARTGDVLVASIAYRSRKDGQRVTVAAPTEWTLAAQADRAGTEGLAVFTRVAGPGTGSATWTLSSKATVVAFMGAFSGVDRERPIDAVQTVTSTDTSTVSVPSITTTSSGGAVVAAYSASRDKGGLKTWSTPTSAAEVGDAQSGNKKLSASLHVRPLPGPGSTGEMTSTSSVRPDAAFGVVVALRSAISSTPTAPVIANVGAIAGTDRATVTWTTDTAADSQVEYGTTPDYGLTSTLDPSPVLSHVVELSRLAANTTYRYRVRSTNAGGTTTGPDLTFRTGGAPSGPVRVIVDTDIFSDADDVTALATAFGLQKLGEAQVIAVGVNTRTSRPAVSNDSWRCAAAVMQWYGAEAVPLGTSLPNNGTDVNTPDFVRPCAALASPATPTPDTAVNVYRRTLAAQPDNSVVVVSTGYLSNLSALLESAPDVSSPLSGRALIAQKVNRLVAMGGGYPTWPGENNLRGAWVAAQNVAANWTAPIVWAGYEVGDPVHTGQTISRVHPANSPVRVAYEAFVRPGNWIYSYDLVAVYHAVRPNDPRLTVSGPGRNTVDANGGNVFTPNAVGTQRYLLLSDPDGLSASIESLLQVIPSAGTDGTPPQISAIRSETPTANSATITWTTDEASTSQVIYGTTTGYGAETVLDTTKLTSHSQIVTGLFPATTYRYRVRSADAAGNLATSGEATFTTSPIAGGLNQLVLFDDALTNADDWGWAPRNYASTSPVQSGTRAIAVTADPWAGLQLHLQRPFTTLPGSILEFWINGENGGQQLTVELLASGTRRLSVPIGALAPNQWRKVQVDVSTLGTIDLVVFLNNTPNAGGRYSLDGVRLTW